MVYSKRMSILSAILVHTFTQDVIPFAVVFAIWIMSFVGPLYILIDRDQATFPRMR